MRPRVSAHGWTVSVSAQAAQVLARPAAGCPGVRGPARRAAGSAYLAAAVALTAPAVAAAAVARVARRPPARRAARQARRALRAAVGHGGRAAGHGALRGGAPGGRLCLARVRVRVTPGVRVGLGARAAGCDGVLRVRARLGLGKHAEGVQDGPVARAAAARPGRVKPSVKPCDDASGSSAALQWPPRAAPHSEACTYTGDGPQAINWATPHWQVDQHLSEKGRQPRR